MNLKSQRRMAADILKCGTGRIKINPTKDVEEALTRNDIKRLIVKGLITKAPVKGISRRNAKKTAEQKKKGRRAGRGSRKGATGALQGKKERWMKRVRALRIAIKELRETGRISVSDYRLLYGQVKGNAFRSKRHLIAHVKENEMFIKKAVEKSKAKKVKK